MDLVVKGILALPQGPRRGAVGIRDGRIAAVAEDLRGDEEVDVGHRWVLPGAVDVHVHLRDPGHTGKEDLASGTRAAAFGGVTCVLDMPNTDPPTTTPEALREKRRRGEERCLVDFGLYGGATPEPESLDLLDEATALKVYMGRTTGDLLVDDDEVLRRAAVASARTGKVVAFHAEDTACLAAHAGVLGSAAPDDWDAHRRSRPAACEVRAIERVLATPRPPGTRFHVAHLSTAGGLGLVAGTDVSWEVTPHHLLLDARDASRGPDAVMNPPLRDPLDRRVLLRALARTPGAFVASDHAPHQWVEKDTGGVADAPAGIPGVETLLPLILQEVAEGVLPLARAVEVLSTNPAERFRLPKGRLAPGYDADLTIVDPRASRPVRGAALHGRSRWTPFEGRPALFPESTLVRGRWVVRDGETVGPRGWGRYQDGGFAGPAIEGGDDA